MKGKTKNGKHKEKHLPFTCRKQFSSKVNESAGRISFDFFIF